MFDRSMCCRCSVLPVRLALLLSGVAACQGVSAQDGDPEGAGLKTARIVRVAAAPVIDGQLDESVWSQAIPIEDLHQINPIEYADPTVESRVYLLYTEDALYIGARLSDSDAGDITSRILRQGESIVADDFFGVVLDPFNDRRSGYRFGVNANGVRDDLLYQNTSQSHRNWEGIWRAAASRNDEGWVAEMEIPFKTLSFNPANDTWGINFMRWVPRKNE